jgi:IS30 family transposase
MWEGAVGLGTRLSDEERARIAELAATRLPSRLIAMEVGRSHRAVWSFVLKLRQPPPAERRRSLLRLSLTEREEICRGVAGGESLRAIAGRLGRAPSTISREVAINGGRRRYRACRADSDALARARRPKAAKLATCQRLRAVVEARLEKRSSPQQIAGWLPTAFPGDTEMRGHGVPV